MNASAKVSSEFKSIEGTLCQDGDCEPVAASRDGVGGVRVYNELKSASTLTYDFIIYTEAGDALEQKGSVEPTETKEHGEDCPTTVAAIIDIPDQD